MLSDRVRRLIGLWLVTALIAGATATPAGAAEVRDYDLGSVSLPDPGPKGPLPVRLWGAIGLPGGPGPHPLVIVAHGRHGDNCPPAPGDSFEWPCYAREQRNDLGLRYLVRALAERGVAAIAPDLNGAYTIGWGEPDDQRRWPRVVNRTMSELAKEATAGGGRFGVSVQGRVDLGRLGVLGHSRSGHNGAQLVRGRAGNTSPAKIASGQGPIDSLLLLAPAYKGASLPDLEVAIVTSRCDADVPGEGRRYLERARRQPDRDEPAFLVRLDGANHSFYNRTLSALGRDDGRFAPAPGCGRRERLASGRQQRWIDRFASGFFAAELRGAPRPGWMRLRGPEPGQLFGLPVGYERLVP